MRSEDDCVRARYDLYLIAISQYLEGDEMVRVRSHLTHFRSYLAVIAFSHRPGFVSVDLCAELFSWIAGAPQSVPATAIDFTSNAPLAAPMTSRDTALCLSVRVETEDLNRAATNRRLSLPSSVDISPSCEVIKFYPGITSSRCDASERRPLSL